jgi:hypothetical protein
MLTHEMAIKILCTQWNDNPGHSMHVTSNKKIIIT